MNRKIKKSLDIIILMFLFYSCSSDQTKVNKDQENSNLMKNIPFDSKSNSDEIKDEDENKPLLFNNSSTPTRKLVPFTSSEDKYKEIYSALKNYFKFSPLLYETLNPVKGDDFNQLSDFYRDRGDELVSLAELCYQGKFQNFEMRSKELYPSYKKFPSYWVLLGNSEVFQANYLKAKLYFNKALELEQNYIPALNNLGFIYLKEEKDQKALIAFQKAYKQSSFSLTPVYNLANLYLKYDFYDQAISLVKPLFERSPSDPTLIHLLAISYLNKGESKKSLEYFDLMEPSQGNRLDVKTSKVMALFLSGNKKDSKILVQDISESQTENKELKEYIKNVKDFIQKAL